MSRRAIPRGNRCLSRFFRKGPLKRQKAQGRKSGRGIHDPQDHGGPAPKGASPRQGDRSHRYPDRGEDFAEIKPQVVGEHGSGQEDQKKGRQQGPVRLAFQKPVQEQESQGQEKHIKSGAPPFRGLNRFSQKIERGGKQGSHHGKGHVGRRPSSRSMSNLETGPPHPPPTGGGAKKITPPGRLRSTRFRTRIGQKIGARVLRPGEPGLS